VPPALKNCRWAGLLVDEWMKERLVDVLIPSQLMTLAHDMPVDEFVALAAPAGARICPSIYPRTSWTWPFTSSPAESSYAAPAARTASPELIRGAAANYWHMGATSFQLYNFNLPPDDMGYRAMRDLAAPGTLGRSSRVYAITPAYYLDSEDTYQYRKQIPAPAAPDGPLSLTILVGEKLTGSAAPPKPDYCGLRLGLRDADRATKLRVEFNGRVIHDGSLADRFTAVKSGAPPKLSGRQLAPTAYAQFPLEDLRLIRQGANAIEIAVEMPAEDGQITVVEAQLGVLYTRSLSELLFSL
jgi:hypothetical protein